MLTEQNKPAMIKFQRGKHSYAEQEPLLKAVSDLDN